MDNTMTQSKQSNLTLKQYQDKLMADSLADLQVNTQRGIVFPKNYVPQNALMNAILYLAQTVDKDKNPVLSVCSPESVKQALLDMLQAGLNVGKKQGYFIAYGKKLTWFTSYFGYQCQAKAADPEIQDVYAEVVYQGDIFRYQIKHGQKFIVEHSQDPDNIDITKIKGAYATLLYKNGEERSEYMSIEQIHNSWQRGQTKGGSDAHRLAPEEMCKRTVIRRLVKPVINASDDFALIDQVSEIDRIADEKQARITIDVTPPELKRFEPDEEKDPISDETTTSENSKPLDETEQVAMPWID